jgi:hypothetical protein
MTDPGNAVPFDEAKNNSPFLSEIVSDVSVELGERLEGELTDRDDLAVTSAVAKAAWRGFYRGVAAEAEALREAGLDAQTWIHLPDGDPNEPDPWLDAYGDDALVRDG